MGIVFKSSVVGGLPIVRRILQHGPPHFPFRNKSVLGPDPGPIWPSSA